MPALRVSRSPPQIAVACLTVDDRLLSLFAESDLKNGCQGLDRAQAGGGATPLGGHPRM